MQPMTPHSKQAFLHAGAVRVSFGYMSTFQDAQAVLR